MKKTIIAVLVLCSFALAHMAAAGTSIPKPVKDLFSDVMVVMAKLGKDLKASKDAQGVSKSFDVATASFKSKKIAERYTGLEAQYPEFFEDNSDMDDDSMPPEWVALVADYEAAWSDYGSAYEVIMKYGQDPGVQKSIEAFQAEISALDSADAGDEYSESDATTAATEES